MDFLVFIVRTDPVLIVSPRVVPIFMVEKCRMLGMVRELQWLIDEFSP